MSLFRNYQRAGWIPKDMTNEVFTAMVDQMHDDPEAAESICAEHFVDHKHAGFILEGIPPQFPDDIEPVGRFGGEQVIVTASDVAVFDAAALFGDLPGDPGNVLPEIVGATVDFSAGSLEAPSVAFRNDVA